MNLERGGERSWNLKKRAGTQPSSTERAAEKSIRSKMLSFPNQGEEIVLSYLLAPCSY